MILFLSLDDIGDIYHVGTMDINLKSSQSHEWNGLSISNCPQAWKEISGCYGTTWKLVPNEIEASFLSFYDLDENDISMIKNWSLESGYFASSIEYRVYWYDEEYEEEHWFVFEESEKQEALDEYECRIAEEYEGVRFEEYSDGLTPTEQLMNMSLTDVPVALYTDIAVMLYAEEVLECDGVWWEERFDPLGLSAPRGVIFNSHLSRFKPQKDDTI